MSTIRFGRDERERDELLAKVGALPKAIEPPRDLWPAIEARLDEQLPAEPASRRGLPWHWALAAGIAVASVSVLFTWMMVKPAGEGTIRTAATPPAATALQPVSFGQYERLGTDYVETRRQMLDLFNSRLETLPPETRDRVQADLVAIRKAASDIDTALASDPSSQLLNRLLLSTYQEEMRLYTRVAAPNEASQERT